VASIVINGTVTSFKVQVAGKIKINCQRSGSRYLGATIVINETVPSFKVQVAGKIRSIAREMAAGI
jgi:hypothetical protein